MTTVEIRRKLKAKEMILGTHVSLSDPCITELLGDLPFDILWLDWEHSALDRQSIQAHLMAARGTNAAAFVRVPWNDPVIAKPILEMGPDGLIFPMICTEEEAKQAVAACTYPPKGIRGFGPRRANRYGMIPNDKYIAEIDANLFKVMQIEHITAVQNLSAILDVEGIDSIVVGPNDLSGSVGLLGQTRHPEVLKLLDCIAETCNKKGVPFGVSMGLDPVSLNDWKRRGVSWVIAGGDTAYLLQGGLGAHKQLTEIFK